MSALVFVVSFMLAFPLLASAQNTSHDTSLPGSAWTKAMTNVARCQRQTEARKKADPSHLLQYEADEFSLDLFVTVLRSNRISGRGEEFVAILANHVECTSEGLEALIGEMMTSSHDSSTGF